MQPSSLNPGTWAPWVVSEQLLMVASRAPLRLSCLAPRNCRAGRAAQKRHRYRIVSAITQTGVAWRTSTLIIALATVSAVSAAVSLSYSSHAMLALCCLPCSTCTLHPPPFPHLLQPTLPSLPSLTHPCQPLHPQAQLGAGRALAGAKGGAAWATRPAHDGAPQAPVCPGERVCGLRGTTTATSVQHQTVHHLNTEGWMQHHIKLHSVRRHRSQSSSRLTG
jgi:hypothetical protein